jgi:hypothetical protein
VGAADLDGDGVVDFLRGQLDLTDATIDAVDRISLQCAGGWAAAAVPGVSLPDDRRIEAVGDVDGDGDPDLLSVRHDAPGAGDVFVQLNDGFGTFAPPIAAAQLVSAAGGTWTLPATIVDVDGDTLPDLIECGGLDHRTCRVHSGLGDGTFASPGPSFVLGSGVEALAVGDVDGDGLADLVFGLSSTFDPGALYLASGDGSGGFSGQVEILDVAPTIEVGPGAGRGWVRLADVDGDLLLDLAILWDTGIDGADRALAIAIGDGLGAFTLGSSQALVSASADAASPDSFAAGP